MSRFKPSFYQTTQEVQKRKLLIPVRLNALPTVMGSPPTVALGTTSTITNAVNVISVSGTSYDAIYRFIGDITRADWNGTTHTGAFPDYTYVKNIAVTTTNSFGNLTVECDFDGTEIEFIIKGQGQKYRLWVDEGSGYQLATASAQSGPASDGSKYYLKATFASRSLRRMKLETGGFFGGVNIGPNDTLFPIARPLGPKAIFFGDSFTEGTGADASFTGYATTCSQLLGWNGWLSGSGGTGYINPGTGGRVKFQDRVQHDVIDYSPDIVIVQGGNNDTASLQADVQTAATTLLNTLKTGLPNAKIIVLSNFAVQGSTASITNTRTAIKNAALALNLPFIDSLAGITYMGNGAALPGASGMWITGTGNTGSPQVSGNATYYTYTDNGHPSQVGHRYIGERIATEIYRLLN